MLVEHVEFVVKGDRGVLMYWTWDAAANFKQHNHVSYINTKTLPTDMV